MSNKETKEQRSKRILSQLREKYPGKKAFDLDGRGKHFACEIEPTQEHPEYDRAIEVIISSQPHKHLKTTNYYTVISGTLELHVENKTIILKPGDSYTVEPGKIHWAKSDNECWAEIYSEPGWTKEDHIPVDNSDN
jgi:mannose-6-phosphate isomerase-like protein (cupin superfamily)